MKMNFYKYLFIILLSVLSLKSECQTEHINGISLFFPGYLHELPIFNQLTARLQLGIMPQIQQSKNIETGINGYLSGLASFSFRNYYNLNSRQNRGKNTSLNSADYVSIMIQYITPPVVFYDNACKCIDFEGDRISRAEEEKEDIMQGLLLGVNWGIQRNFSQKFSVDLNVGPAYSLKSKDFTFLANLTLLIFLNQNSNNYW